MYLFCSVVPVICGTYYEQRPALCGHIFWAAADNVLVNLPAVTGHLLYVATFSWQKGWLHTAGTMYSIQGVHRIFMGPHKGVTHYVFRLPVFRPSIFCPNFLNKSQKCGEDGRWSQDLLAGGIHMVDCYSKTTLQWRYIWHTCKVMGKDFQWELRDPHVPCYTCMRNCLVIVISGVINRAHH